MWYEINVAKNGRHFFATHERSIKAKDELIEVLKEFKRAFREEDGYKITVTKWETKGYGFDEKETNDILSLH